MVEPTLVDVGKGANWDEIKAQWAFRSVTDVIYELRGWGI